MKFNSIFILYYKLNNIFVLQIRVQTIIDKKFMGKHSNNSTKD